MIFSKKKPIVSINYYGLSDFDIIVDDKITRQDSINIASFLYLLTYNSPILNDCINKLKDCINKNDNISTIIDSWTTIYLTDFNNPIIKPVDAFKLNVK